MVIITCRNVLALMATRKYQDHYAIITNSQLHWQHETGANYHHDWSNPIRIYGCRFTQQMVVLKITKDAFIFRIISVIWFTKDHIHNETSYHIPAILEHQQAWYLPNYPEYSVSTIGRVINNRVFDIIVKKSVYISRMNDIVWTAHYCNLYALP